MQKDLYEEMSKIIADSKDIEEVKAKIQSILMGIDDGLDERITKKVNKREEFIPMVFGLTYFLDALYPFWKKYNYLWRSIEEGKKIEGINELFVDCIIELCEAVLDDKLPMQFIGYIEEMRDRLFEKHELYVSVECYAGGFGFIDITKEEVEKILKNFKRIKENENFKKFCLKQKNKEGFNPLI